MAWLPGIYASQFKGYLFGLTGPYPVNLTVLSPGTFGDAATFDVADWEAYTGTGLVISAGSYYRGGNQNGGWTGQVVDIPSEYWKDIDAGIMKLTASHGLSSFTDSDSVNMGLDCLAADFTYLGGEWSGYLQGNDTNGATYTQVEFECLVPPGTRKVRLSHRAYRAGNVEHSVYWNDIGITLDVSGSIFEPLYAMRGVETSDWTYRNGAPLGQVSTWGYSWHNQYDETGRENSRGGYAGGVGSTWGVKQEFLTDEFSVPAKIAFDLGNLEAFNKAWAWDDTNRENGGLYMRTHSATTGDSNVEQNINAFTGSLRQYGTYQKLSLTFNPLTDVRLENFFYATRDAGSYADSAFNYSHMGLSYPAPADYVVPAFEDVVLLLGFHGDDADTVIQDQSYYANVTTVGGNAQIDTAQSKFGGSSLLLDGSGDYTVTTHRSELSVANTDDFTMEAWFRLASGATGINTILNKRDGSGAEEFSMAVDGTSVLFQMFNSSTVASITSATGLVSTETWHHIAATREGDEVKLYLDGVLVGTDTQSGLPAANTSSAKVGFDGFNGSRAFSGHIDEVRIVRSVVYSSSFTPSIYPHPRYKGYIGDNINVPAYEDVVFYSDFEGADGSTTFTDQSATEKTIISTGTPSIQTDEFKIGTSSLYLDGSGDYLSVAHEDALSIANADDFTMEAYIYLEAAATGQNTIINKRDGSSAEEFSLHTSSVDDTLIFVPYRSGSSVGTMQSPYPIPRDTWTHVAITREGSELTMFIDGEIVAKTTQSLTPSGNSADWRIGRSGFASGREFQGYIDEVRMTRSVVYTGPFLPPTETLADPRPVAPQPAAFSSVKWLSGFDSGFTDESDSARTLTERGDAARVTTQARFGTHSVYCDGDGDYVFVSDATDVSFNNSTDFTLEAWVRIPADQAGQQNAIFDKRDTSLADEISVYKNTGDGPTFILWNQSNAIMLCKGVDGSFTFDTWHHIAAVREGTACRLYFNGVLVDEDTQSQTPSGNSAGLRFGRDNFNFSRDLKGWIDEVRLTREAIYTADFRPPNNKFPRS